MDKLTFRSPNENDLPAMAAVAARGQNDPDQVCLYLGMSAVSIAADIGNDANWTKTTVVAEQDGALVAWLMAEVEPDMGRLWWWGPFSPDGLEPVGDQLHTEVRACIAANFDIEFPEEEALADARSTSIPAWCERHGLEPETASVLLKREGGEAKSDPRIRPLAASATDRAAVEALHDLAFAGTHTTGAALVVADDPRQVIEVDGAIVGYVAYELQSDGSGYIDYLAVDEAMRSQGLGGALVDHACKEMFEAGVSYAHLTVREDNQAARALYARLGFVEERLARPFRRGFKLD